MLRNKQSRYTAFSPRMWWAYSTAPKLTQVTKNSDRENTDVKWNQTIYATVPSTRGPRGVNVCTDKSVCQSPTSTQMKNRLWHHQQALHSSNATHRRGKHDFASWPTNAQTLHVILSEELELGQVNFNAPFDTHSSVNSDAAFEVIRSTGIRLKELSYLNRSHTQTQPYLHHQFP